jgi:hypothetical protein
MNGRGIVSGSVDPRTGARSVAGALRDGLPGSAGIPVAAGLDVCPAGGALAMAMHLDDAQGHPAPRAPGAIDGRSVRHGPRGYGRE